MSYYECHVTIDSRRSKGCVADPVRECEMVVNLNGWSFSAINGDIVLGKRGFMYSTKHVDSVTPIGSVIAMVEEERRRLSHCGFAVVRSKVELVLHDNREESA